MNKLNTQLYDEASEWIILHRSDDLDAEAKRRFDAWVRESPQHLKAYLEISTIWEDVPTLQHDWNPSANELIARAREDANVFPLGVDVIPAEAGIQLREPPLVSVERAITIPASSARTKLLTLAAAVIALAGFATWLFVFHNVYSTDIGEQRTLALEDGSSVELNAQTKIRVAYTDDARTIELLQGQALFKAAKDPQRPFIVDSAGTKIRAVGTQFDVYKKSTGTQVTVVEGRVAVRAPTVPGAGDSGVSGLSREVPTAHRGSAEETQGFSGLSRPPKDDEATAGPSSSLAHAPLQAELGEVLVSAGEQIVIAQAAPELAVPDVGRVPTTTKAATPAPLVEGRAVSGTVVPANIEAATAWTQQRLVFDFAPLTEVAQEFNRYNRRPMKVDCAVGRAVSGTLCNFNISGSFSSTDPTLLLRFLREQPGIVVTETNDEIRISRQDTTNG